MRGTKKAAMLLLALLFAGCDIPGHLLISNKTQEVVTYKEYASIPEGSASNFTVILPPIRGKRKLDVLFGFGDFWTDKRIREYLSSVAKIEILSAKDTLVLAEKESMISYFQERRRGVFKQYINITVR